MSRTAQSDIRQKIVDAAEIRLWHFGFKKTTIDEIASDAGVGKGTVYLYFESKEDIAVAIVAQYKQQHLEQQGAIARDAKKSLPQRLKDMLTLPIQSAHQRCSSSPGAQEMVVAVRPHIQARLRDYMENEIHLLAEVLEEGNTRHIFHVGNAEQAARTLKYMTVGFLPPYSYVSQPEEIASEISRMVNLVVRGLHNDENKDKAAHEDE